MMLMMESILMVPREVLVELCRLQSTFMCVFSLGPPSTLEGGLVVPILQMMVVAATMTGPY